MEQTLLKDFAGQRCDVTLVKLDGGYRYAIFAHALGYGFPSLSVEEVEHLLRKLKNM